MTNSVPLREAPATWEALESHAADVAVWRAGVAKGVEEDWWSSAAFLKTVHWIALAVLLGASALWSQAALYALPIRFIVVAGAIAVMSRALRSRQYVLAVMFAVLALLYNPVVPTFSFSGSMQQDFVGGTAVLFATAMVWRKDTVVRNV